MRVEVRGGEKECKVYKTEDQKVGGGGGEEEKEGVDRNRTMAVGKERRTTNGRVTLGVVEIRGRILKSNEK